MNTYSQSRLYKIRSESRGLSIRPLGGDVLVLILSVVIVERFLELLFFVVR